MQGWKKVDELPQRTRNDKSPARIEAEKVIEEFIESGDDCWGKDISGYDRKKTISLYHNATKNTMGKVKSSVRGDTLYLIRKDR